MCPKEANDDEVKIFEAREDTDSEDSDDEEKFEEAVQNESVFVASLKADLKKMRTQEQHNKNPNGSKQNTINTHVNDKEEEKIRRIK